MTTPRKRRISDKERLDYLFQCAWITIQHQEPVGGMKDTHEIVTRYIEGRKAIDAAIRAERASRKRGSR